VTFSLFRFKKEDETGVMKYGQPAIFLAFLILSTFSGCSLKNNSDDPTPATPTTGVAFFHAAPSSPSMDVILDNATINTSNFTYSSFSGYLSLTPGSHKVRFANIGDHSTLVDTTLTFLVDKSYSLILYNQGVKTKSLVTLDEPTLFTSTTGIMVRFIHLSPDAPEVKVTMAGESKVLSDQSDFTEATLFTEYQAKNNTLEVRSTADDHLVASVAFDATTPHQYFTIALLGYVNPPVNNNNKITLKVIPH
jgi:hypothetical protein